MIWGPVPRKHRDFRVYLTYAHVFPTWVYAAEYCETGVEHFLRADDWRQEADGSVLLLVQGKPAWIIEDWRKYRARTREQMDHAWEGLLEMLRIRTPDDWEPYFARCREYVVGAFSRPWTPELPADFFGDDPAG
ncbi:MAG: hypothetical protein D6766_09035 [Verrucomicrobia bacterium]|nr:MAG: hypothetical protein D6766_09035 [Verrucomicrobiota bacterium]